MADSATGATIERVSDHCELTPATKRSLIVYSRFSPSNSSNEYVLVHGENSTSSHVYRLSDNLKVATLTYDGVHTIGELNEIRWDYTKAHPNRIYFVVGMKFFQMDVLKENGAATLIRDFSSNFPEGSVIANDVEGDSSNDSRFWAWQVLDKRYSPYATRLIFTYDKETDTILGVLRPEDVGQCTIMSRPNMVEISPLGTKVITHYGAASSHPSVLLGKWQSLGNGTWELSGYKAQTSGNNAFALVTADGVPLAKRSSSTGSAADICGDNQYANNSSLDKFWIRLTAGEDPNGKVIVADWGTRPADVGTVLDAPRAWDLDFKNPVTVSVSETHSGWAFDAEGREWFVSQNNKTDWIEARDILTGKAMNILYHGDLGWSNGIHFGKFYDRSQRGWLMMSTYSKVNSEWGNNQTILVELKPASANPAVWRVTPSYNQYLGNYRDEGPAALGYDGKSIFWTGNWGSANGYGEVYRVKLPEDWYEHFPGELHPDTTAPTVLNFSAPSTSYSLTVSIQELVAADNVGVVGYLVTEAATAPAANDLRWSPSVPRAYTFSDGGTRSLYAWAKDAAGNVGSSLSVSVHVVTDTVAPAVSIVSPVNSSTVGGAVAVSANASDNVAVSRVEFYLNGALKATSTSAPYGFTWNTAGIASGSYVLSAKAYDAAGNVGQSANVTVKVAGDTVAPTITSFSMPTTANSTTVAVSSFTASDNLGVAGYLVTESGSRPSATAAGWNSTAPAYFTFAGTGTRTAYAWVKDAAGNVSAGSARPVLIDTTLPVIKSVSMTRSASSLTVKASATDNVKIAKTQIFVDGALQIESSASSLSCVWKATYKGTHTVTVKAYDAAGNEKVKSLRVSM